MPCTPQSDSHFAWRTPCAPEMPPVFPHACHAQQKLASFCSSISCVTKTCLVLFQHAMRDKNLPRFAPACHARQKLAPFYSSTPCALGMTPVFPLACRAKLEMTLFFVLAQENEDHPWFLLFVLPHHHTISQDIPHATLRTRRASVGIEAEAMTILTDPSDLPRRIAHH